MSFITSHHFTVYHYCGQMVGAAYNGHDHRRPTVDEIAARHLAKSVGDNP